jgi:hypothetical protein
MGFQDSGTLIISQRRMRGQRRGLLQTASEVLEFYCVAVCSERLIEDYPG